MSTLNSYDSISQSWRVLGSTDASQIMSRNPKLGEYAGKEAIVPIENVLEKVIEDMKLAKGNISWLALHGGGGSGGGGSQPTAEGTIKVNGLDKGASIIRKDSERLYFEVEQPVTKTWSYVVTFNGKVIKTGNIINGTVTIADASTILDYPSSGSGLLSITCSSGISNISWSGTIIRNQLFLYAEQMVLPVADIDTKVITYKYSGSIVGKYKLAINGREIREVQINTIGQEYTINVGVNEVYNATDIGSNTTVVTLVNVVDATVITTIVHQIVITSDNIIISSDLSKDANAPTVVAKNANIPCKFTAYLTNETVMYYTIKLNGVTLYELEPGTFNIQTIKYISTADPSLVIGNSYELEITAESTTRKIGVGKFYIEIGRASNITLQVPKINSLLVDYRAFGNTGTYNLSSVNEHYILNGTQETTVTNSIVQYNPNILSGIKASEKDPTYYRLSNKAFAVGSPINIGGNPYLFQDILDMKKAFTVHLCFKADYHTDDNKTVFQLGRLDAENELENGILIQVHKIQIKEKNKNIEWQLQDNQIYTVDITYSNGTVKLYINGVITKAAQDINNLDFSGCTPYLGCSYNGSEYLFYSDCQFYRFMLYSEALTDYDITLNNLQNEAYTHFTSDGIPDDNYILSGFERNFLEYDETNNVITNSWLWDNNLKDYSLGNFVLHETDQTGKVICKLNPNINTFNIPIPVLFLDVSSSSAWTWENFSAAFSQTSLEKVSNVRFNYYDQKGTNSNIIEGSCQIDIQGTSTRSNSIKNLNMDLRPTEGSSTVNAFVPKANWLAENIYTLKADIVDSSHSLNASIGKFVNDVLANSEDTNRWFPLHGETLAKFKDAPYYKACETKPTMKVAVEGFPVFVIIRFYDVDPTKIIVKSLGIYQFILGRDSVHNLGLKVLNNLKKGGENIVPSVFPFYEEGCTFDEANMESYWIEAKDTKNVLKGVDFTQDLTECTGLTALCWQPTEGVINNHFEVKSGTIKTPFLAPGFADLMRDIAKVPTVLYNYFDASNNENKIKDLISTSYPELTTSNGNDYTPTGGRVQVVTSDDDAASLSQTLDLEVAYKYATVGMGFGLSDNYCKNMPFILFNSATNRKYRNTLYDMDTGAGGDNNGSLTTPPHLYFKGLLNDINNVVGEVFSKGDNSIISGVDNKLWLSLEHSKVARNTAAGDKDNPYSYFWVDFRNYVYNKYKDTYADFTDYFMNEYFLPQTEGCGELLFNLTYTTKYLTTAQADYLSGRRIQQVTQWLKEHIDFLDSITAWKSCSLVLPDDKNDAFVRIYSKDDYTTIPLKYNKTLVIKTTDQGGNYSYPAFCTKNVFTNVRYGAGTASANPIQKSISWSNSLLSIGNEEQPFGQSGFSRMDTNPLLGFNDLDLSHCTTLSSTTGVSPISFEATFYNPKTGISELRTINLEGATNFQNVNNFVLNLAKFTKITDINIRNSAVGSIILPSTPLVSLAVEGSYLTEFNLSQQNLLTEANIEGCIKLSSLSVRDCEKITRIKGLNNLQNLKNVVVANCPIETLEITNCNLLSSIQLAIPALKKLVITNCKALSNINIAGCTSLEDIEISSCPAATTIICDKFTAEGIFPRTLKKLNLYNTKITTITNNRNSNYLDLQDFSILEDINLGYNSEVTEIAFANNRDYAVPLRHPFIGCVKLRRISGHTIVYNTDDGLFNGCVEFSIHNGSYFGKTVKDSTGKYFLPSEIEESTFDSSTSRKPCNMEFGGTQSYSMFKGTNCDQFDIYYFFENLGTITSAHYTFWNIRNKVFNWTANCDNSPHRDMFKKAAQLVTLNNPAAGSCGYHRLYSPTTKNGVLQDDGLLSPLVNLEFFNWWSAGTYLADRKLFRTSQPNKLKSITYYSPKLIVDDVNALSYFDVSNATQLSNFLSSDDNFRKVGNLSNVFDSSPNLTSVFGFLNSTIFINYDLWTDKFKIPTGVTSLASTFRSSYATGKIDIENYFATPNKVKTLYQSFIQYNDNAENAILDAIFANSHVDINEGMFRNFTALTHIGYNTSGDFAGSANVFTFGGFVQKTVEENESNEFPYNIFANNTELVQVVGLFANAKMKVATQVELPGRMFVNNRKLENCTKLFYNFQTDYSLTSNSFENCPNLSNVSYMFGQPSDSGEFHLKGQIPARLFYHGGEYQTITIQGSNEEVSYTEEGEIDYSGLVPETTTFRVFIPKATIVDMRYVFQRVTTTPYENLNPAHEGNIDYMPYKHVYKNGVWSEAEVNPYSETFIWEYDGANIPQGYENYENLDEEVINFPPVYAPDGTSISGTPNFLCAPDLFRYCTNSANIRGVFAHSGSTQASKQYEDKNSDKDLLGWGVEGRIPPYLLKPVYNTRDISYLFYACRRISSYSNNDVTAKVPMTFFKYAPNITSLSHTFSYFTFDSNTSLNVFSYLTGTLDISYIFFKLYAKTSQTERWNVAGLFTGKRIGNLNHCFSLHEGFSDPEGDVSSVNRNIYVTYSGMFTPSYVSSTKDANGNFTDSQAFSGYSSNTVQFGTKTLSEDAGKYNYKTKS